MRGSTIVVAAFLAILLAGCGADTTATGGTQPETTTAGTVASNTQPETTAGTLASNAQPEETTAGSALAPEKTAPATAVEPAEYASAGWVSAVGDSAMLGAIDALQEEIPNLVLIDAQGSRQAAAAIDVLRRRGAAGQLGDAVVVHIGNNGPFTAEQFDEMMEALAGIREVFMVNLTVPPGVDDPIAVPNDAVLAEAAQRYPNVVLVDWRAASAGHPEFFSGDGIHLAPQGAQAYAGLISAQLGGDQEGSVTLPGPPERIFWGEGGFSGECVGPPSWCLATAP